MTESRGHRDLEVWNRSIRYVRRIYEVTGKYPKEELYGLVSQMRRCAVSIPSNIAEGSTRQSTKEYIHFLYIALGSASELEVQLILSRDLAYISEDTFDELMNEREDISRMLSGQIRSLKAKL